MIKSDEYILLGQNMMVATNKRTSQRTTLKLNQPAQNDTRLTLPAPRGASEAMNFRTLFTY
jgi:hypothetical protein